MRTTLQHIFSMDNEHTLIFFWHSTGDIEIHDLREKRGVLENIASVASMRDVINDTVESFKSAKMYVDVGDFGSVSVDEKVKRTGTYTLIITPAPNWVD